MNTKAIREALALVREDKHPEALKKAMEAVEAIEMAAKEWTAGAALLPDSHKTDWRRILESIAKEAP